jgi:thioredoxin-like negative regulator of GroEL
LRAKSLLLLAIVIAASCTPTDVPPPTVTPQGDDRFLIDPRTGDTTALAPKFARQFETAWRHVLAGNTAEARKKLDEIRRTNPGYVPVLLAQAAVEIKEGRFDAAHELVVAAQERVPDSIAAQTYDAEIATREGKTRIAYDLYRALATRPDAPKIAIERVAQLQEAIFNELYTAAQTAPDTEAIRLLREALLMNAGTADARILLARKLVAQRQFDEARKELDPLLNTIADRAEIQELLAEIEVGRGRYQEAIVRLDRLARRTKDPRYEKRLDEIKLEWSAANMPAHFRSALESAAITRAELATLLYWTVPSVRFAQNLGAPEIAVDIDEVQGRDEMIRAIALGLYDVDPVTRRVSPFRTVSAGRLSTLLARVLTSRGAACARGLSNDRVLAACGVTDPLTTASAESTVTGRDAQKALEQIAKKL